MKESIIRNAILDELCKRDMSLNQLCEQVKVAGVGRSTVYRFLVDGKTCSVHNAEAMMKVFGIKVSK